MVAYRKGLMYEAPKDQVEKKILNVVRMNMFQDSPYVAGKLLESEMKATLSLAMPSSRRQSPPSPVKG